MRSYFSLSSFITVLVTIALLIVGLFLYSLFGSVDINLGQATERTFTVEGKGTVDVTPDTYTSTFTVRETGNTQQIAQEAGNTKQNEALQALQDLGVAEEDVKTTQYAINPIFDFSGDTREETGYEFTQSTTIETKERAVMEQALDALAGIGINIGGIQVEADEEEYMQEARKKAIEDARAKAEELAQAGGFRVGNIVTIAEFQSGPELPYLSRESAVGTGAPALDQSVISPGTDEVTATVSVTYYIK